MTLSELQPLRDALVKAIAGGYRSLTVGDKRIEYQNTEQMNAALAQLDREIAAATSGSSGGLRVTFGQFLS
jgi:hypothetical protein